MRHPANLVVIAVTLALAACASHRDVPGSSGVIVDMQGVDSVAYRRDLAECQAYADQVPTGERVATGAAVGAAVGGTLGAVLGGGDRVERGAGVGAVSGGVRGAQSGISEARQVLRNCMIGRGYRVLN